MSISITSDLSIPESEVSFSTARSAGPGGQHVNKVNSRVILEFDLLNSSALTQLQKKRLTRELRHRINLRGVLRLQSQRFRSQNANRADLVEKFVLLLREGLKSVKHRIPTNIPKGIREKRLDTKKQRGHLKRIRRLPNRFEES